MKIFALIITVLLGHSAFSQSELPGPGGKYPFDLKFLEHFSIADDSILPFQDGAKFYYINLHTNKKVNSKGFDIAYPFNGKYALVEEDGEYGVVDRAGTYFLKPIYKRISFGTYFGEIRFDDEPGYFSLYSGSVRPFRIDGEPVGPQMSYYKGSDNKFGLIFKDQKRTDPIYDSVIYLGFNYIVLESSKRIGIIGDTGEVCYPFEYKDYKGNSSFSYYNLFALRKGRIWHYFFGTRKLFESKIKPALLNNNVILFETHGLYNYMDNNGKIMLAQNYKWISVYGNVAINENGDVVLFDRNKNPHIYYKN